MHGAAYTQFFTFVQLSKTLQYLDSFSSIPLVLTWEWLVGGGGEPR